MDFSGQTGRVIENPAEAQSAALEEGHAWRVRLWPGPTPGLPQRNSSVLAAGMRSQRGGVAVSSHLREAVASLGSSTPRHPATPPGSTGAPWKEGQEQSPEASWPTSLSLLTCRQGPGESAGPVVSIVAQPPTSFPASNSLLP